MKTLTIFAFSISIFLSACPTGAFGQTDESRTSSPPVFPQEKIEVVSVVKTLFDGMRAGDSTAVRSVFHPGASMLTAYTKKDGQPGLHTGAVEGFVRSVGTPHDEVWDEKIWGYTVQVEDDLATVWTPYTFFLGETMSHCGINTFLLHRRKSGHWKILSIADTRRNTDCQTEVADDAKTIHSLMDNWHRAAATADEDTFFGSMAEDGIYLGTDATERWLRDDMREWSKEYFERESAWDFTAMERHVYFSEDGRTAWFEEELDTWMGICRGSGVLTLTNDGWKIRHYNLAVTVPNEVIEGFIELVKNAPEKK